MVAIKALSCRAVCAAWLRDRFHCGAVRLSAAQAASEIVIVHVGEVLEQVVQHDEHWWPVVAVAIVFVPGPEEPVTVVPAPVALVFAPVPVAAVPAPAPHVPLGLVVLVPVVPAVLLPLELVVLVPAVFAVLAPLVLVVLLPVVPATPVAPALISPSPSEHNTPEAYSEETQEQAATQEPAPEA